MEEVRTSPTAAKSCAFGPSRKSCSRICCDAKRLLPRVVRYRLQLGEAHEATGIYQAHWRGGCMAGLRRERSRISPFDVSAFCSRKRKRMQRDKPASPHCGEHYSSWDGRKGGNLQIEVRWTSGSVANARKYAAELVGIGPDVILTTGGSTLGPLLQINRVVPIVFVQVIDPVGAGFVASLTHPGGNATGFIQFEYSLSAKWLELLKEIALVQSARLSFGMLRKVPALHSSPLSKRRPHRCR